jgi:hypothetical protein
MNPLEYFGVAVVATVLQLPFLLALSLPWLLVAWAVAVLTRHRAAPLPRVAMISAAAAIGLAPAYGAHMSVLPAYLVAISGEFEPLPVSLSFLLTWALVAVLVHAFIDGAVRSERPEGSS